MSNRTRYDAYRLDRARNIRQNNWTMKYRSVTYKKYEVIDSVRLNKNPKHDAFLFDRVGSTR